MRIKSHYDIYKEFEKKADIVNNKVPVSQLPNNIIYSGLTGLTPILETPTIDADGITLRFTNAHNLLVGQPIIVEDNDGVIPAGIRNKNFLNSVFSQLRDKRLFYVYSVPTSTTIKVSVINPSISASAPATINRGIEVIGGTEFVAPISTPAFYCMDKDSMGNIYVAFYDYNVSGKCTVRKFNGSIWSTVGAAGFTNTSINNFYSLAVAQDDTIYFAYTDQNIKGNVMKYNGTAWVAVGTVFPASGTALYPTISIYNNVPYIAFADSSQASKCVVRKFDGTNWIDVGTNPISAGATTGSKIKIATNGDIYVAYADGSASSKVTVKKFDGTTWSTVGALGFSTIVPGTLTLSISLALGADNTPYVAFTNSSYIAYAMKFNGTAWVTLGSQITAASSNISIIVASDNSVYATYMETTGKSLMSKFGGSVWETPMLLTNENYPSTGLLKNNEYYFCGKSFISSNYIVGKYGAIDNGNGLFRISNLSTRYDILNLNFNNDGGTYDVDLKSLLIMKTASSFLYLTVNDLNTAIYFSPYSTSSFGSTIYSLVAISTYILNDITLKLSLKRMAVDMIKVEVAVSSVYSSATNSVSGVINNSYIGYIKGAGLEDITKLSLTATGCPLLNDSQIIVRRVINNDK